MQLIFLYLWCVGGNGYIYIPGYLAIRVLVLRLWEIAVAAAMLELLPHLWSVTLQTAIIHRCSVIMPVRAEIYVRLAV